MLRFWSFKASLSFLLSHSAMPVQEKDLLRIGDSLTPSLLACGLMFVRPLATSPHCLAELSFWLVMNVLVCPNTLGVSLRHTGSPDSPHWGPCSTTLGASLCHTGSVQRTNLSQGPSGVFLIPSSPWLRWVFNFSSSILSYSFLVQSLFWRQPP